MGALLGETECVGLEEFNGQACYKVVASPVEGYAEELLYSKESGLLLTRGITRKTGAGDMLSTVKEFRDYAETEGVVSARTVAKKQLLRDRTTGSQRMVQNTVTKVESLEYKLCKDDQKADLG